jgi:hypothetical protein
VSQNETSSNRLSWRLAFAVPIIEALAAWPLFGATTSSQECATGSGSSSLVGFVGFLGLLLAAPIAIALRARVTNTRLKRVILPILASLVFTAVLLFYVSLFWWSSHDCMT